MFSEMDCCKMTKDGFLNGIRPIESLIFSLDSLQVDPQGKLTAGVSLAYLYWKMPSANITSRDKVADDCRGYTFGDIRE